MPVRRSSWSATSTAAASSPSCSARFGCSTRPDRELVRGLVVNKFRGDRSLFVDGERILRERAGLPVVGVVPFVDRLSLPEEDAAELVVSATAATGPASARRGRGQAPSDRQLRRFRPAPGRAGRRAAVCRFTGCTGRTPTPLILPGTKSTAADLAWLRATGLADAIVRLARRGAGVVGICGGFQMLGGRDPRPRWCRISGRRCRGPGPLARRRRPSRARSPPTASWHRFSDGPGWLGALAGQVLTGYEIHMGQTPRRPSLAPRRPRG